MRREIYHWLNVVALFVIALLICNLQTVLLKLPFFTWIGVDLILLLVAYLGLKRGLIEGTLITVVIGRIAEIHSGSPAGYVTSCYLVVFAVTVLTREFFIMESPFSIVVLGLVSGLTWKAAFLILAYRADIFENVWKTSLIVLIPHLVSQALLIRPMFNLLLKLDSLTGVGDQSAFHGAY